MYKRQSSLCNDMCDSFSAEQEEVFCNAVAGELLVPTNELNSFLPSFPQIDDEMEPISFLANRFSVSKDVIIRRLLDTGKINREKYISFCEILKAKRDGRKGDEEKIQNTRKPRKNKRNMSKIIIGRTSSAICRVLYEGYCENIFDAMKPLIYRDLETIICSGVMRYHHNASLFIPKVELFPALSEGKHMNKFHMNGKLTIHNVFSCPLHLDNVSFL